MMKSADLKQHALKLLEMSRKFLAEDGDLDPTAFIITADDQILRPIELENEGAKVESCKKIVEEAQQRKALAIITIFLARSADFSEKDFDQASYSWGDIQHGSTDRSILVTVSGPGVKNWAAALPFTITRAKISFRDLVEFGESVDLGLFPGWSEQIIPRT
jgi:hypothetical protein